MSSSKLDICYALHDFLGENPDEIDFKVGEEIVILERDDQFGDGWFIGRNKRGATGLFPEAYTSSHPVDPWTPASDGSAKTPLPRTNSQNGWEESASLYSAKDSTTSEDEGASVVNPRAVLAAKAAANAEREAREYREREERRRKADEDAYARSRANGLVEGLQMSDESDEESPLEINADPSAAIPVIDTVIIPSSIAPSSLETPVIDTEPPDRKSRSNTVTTLESNYSVPSPDTPLPHIITQNLSTFPSKADSPDSNAAETVVAPAPVVIINGVSAENEQLKQNGKGKHKEEPVTETEEKEMYEEPSNANLTHAFPVDGDHLSDYGASANRTSTYAESTIDFPVPLTAPLQFNLPASINPDNAGLQSSSKTITPTPITSTPIEPVISHSRSSTQATATPGLFATTPSQEELPYDPREWTVAQVVVWAKQRGFDELTLSKFEEHEISGDVLIEMDVAMLKEIDLIAFGKRVHIYNGIKDLKRRLGHGAATSVVSSPSNSDFTTLNASQANTPSPLATSFTPPVGWTHSREGSYDRRQGSEASRLEAAFPTYRSSTAGTVGLSPIDTNVSPGSDFGLSPQSASLRYMPHRSGSMGSLRSALTPASSREPHEPRTKKNSTSNFFAGRSRKPAPLSTSPAMDNYTTKEQKRKSLGSSTASKRSTRLFGSFGGSNSVEKLDPVPPPRRNPLSSNGGSSMSVKTVNPVTPEMINNRLPAVKEGNLMDKIGTPDFSGWMRKKGDKYNTWKQRFFVLKGIHLYYLKSENEQKAKGWVDLTGYRVFSSPDINPGSFGFKIVHETQKPHFFSAEEEVTIRNWMKAILKATISRDYTAEVLSSCDIDTLGLQDAKALNPRPPSPTTRAKAQREKYAGHNTLTPKDARILMEFSSLPPSKSIMSVANELTATTTQDSSSASSNPLLNWVNENIPPNCIRPSNLSDDLRSGEVLVRLLESLSGIPSNIPGATFGVYQLSRNGQGIDPLYFDTVFSVFDYLGKVASTDDISMDDMLSGNTKRLTIFLERVRKTYPHGAIKTANM